MAEDVEKTAPLDVTAKEIQTLFCAMTGNFPESLNPYRWDLLRKMAHAKHQLEPEAGDAS